MTSTMPGNRDTWFADNRANWDDRARLHAEAGYGIPELLASPDAISPEVAFEVPFLGDLTGLDVCHLQCHLGTDTISLARLGAHRVVGVDLSPEALARARDLAGRAGVDVEFVESNVYDARAAVEGDVDLVFTTLGVLCWLPDVAAWARVIASLLRPGGRLHFRDDHPVSMTLDDDTRHGLMVSEPYFEAADPSTWEDDGSYVATAEGSAPIPHTRNHQWNHGVGEIVTALIDAGLVIDEVGEARFASWCRWPELMEADGSTYRFRDPKLAQRVPLQLLIRAHRPA